MGKKTREKILGAMETREKMTAGVIAQVCGISKIEVRGELEKLESKGSASCENGYWIAQSRKSKTDNSPFKRPKYKTPNVGWFG